MKFHILTYKIVITLFCSVTSINNSLLVISVQQLATFFKCYPIPHTFQTVLHLGFNLLISSVASIQTNPIIKRSDLYKYNKLEFKINE